MIGVRLKILLVSGFVFLGLILGSQTYADEPLEGVRQTFSGSNYSWKLEGLGLPVLSLFEGQSRFPFAKYELSGCRFCSGDDDNCESDGIVEINLVSRPQEPILAATCHVGAHSQSLQILRPWLNPSEAVYSATGAYYITFEHSTKGILIEYDARQGDSNFVKMKENWP